MYMSAMPVKAIHHPKQKYNGKKKGSEFNIQTLIIGNQGAAIDNEGTFGQVGHS